MSMVRHNNGAVKRESLAIAPKTSLKRYGSCFWRQDPAMMS